jgi:hypothetical protein
MCLCKLTCTYAQFEQLRDAIYKTIPFAVIHVGYSPKLGVGIFNFWDSDYIPDELKPYILQSPLSRENKDKLTADLAEVMKLIKKV